MSKNKNADSVRIARQYLDSLVIEGRILGAKRPTSKVTVLGKEYETPIMTAALSHLKGGMAGLAEGAKKAGALCSIGMTENPEVGKTIATGADVIVVIKPYASNEEVLNRIRYAEEHGAVGVGMDIEHAINGDDDQEMVMGDIVLKMPSKEDLKLYVESTKLPFFFKGALSVQDALTAREVGAAGIILSHHNSLMPWAIPPYAILPEIRKAVGDDLILIADGGIEDGFDAYKVLALGADLISVGRPFMAPYNQNGADGVSEVIDTMSKELRSMMWRTGAETVKDIDITTLHVANWLQ